MTVAELIRNLQALGIEKQDLPVVVRGYEGGVNDVVELTPIEIVRDANAAGYYGQHAKFELDEPESKEWAVENNPDSVFQSALELVGKNLLYGEKPYC